jgi:hypothetical protein
LVKGSDSLLALDGRKLAEKLVERVPTLQIIEKRLEGHTGANEDRRPFKDVRVAVNDWCASRHDLEYTLSARGVPNEMRVSCGA